MSEDPVLVDFDFGGTRKTHENCQGKLLNTQKYTFLPQISIPATGKRTSPYGSRLDAEKPGGIAAENAVLNAL